MWDVIEQENVFKRNTFTRLSIYLLSRIGRFLLKINPEAYDRMFSNDVDKHYDWSKFKIRKLDEFLQNPMVDCTGKIWVTDKIPDIGAGEYVELESSKKKVWIYFVKGKEIPSIHLQGQFTLKELKSIIECADKYFSKCISSEEYLKSLT
jgi:hypothetical protein